MFTVVKRGLLWLCVALLVSFGLVGPRVVPWAHVALWYASGGGPPLNFNAPRNGQVVAHIDVLGRFTTDSKGTRRTESIHALSVP